MSPAGDDRSTTADPAEAERAEHPDSFDPGPETGYLRRGHRDHDLNIDSGAAPFDPGPDHYDDRRARRKTKETEKAERKRRDREQKQRAAQERAEAVAREKQESPRRERAERARRAADEAQRAERERIERDDEIRAQREGAREAEAEKAERAHVERERLRREERDRAGREREERKRAKQANLNLKPAGKPRPGPPAPRLSDKPAHVSLRLPTVKVGAALLLVVAVAALAGSAAGLPVPGLGDDSPGQGTDDTAVDAASLALLDAGTPVGLSKGPYHPVVGDVDYGESLAKFGAPRSGRLHEGQDLFANPGTPLVSVRDGVIVDSGTENGRYSGGRGNYIVVYSRLDDRSYVYLHLLKPAIVDKGEAVEAGQPLGQMGCTGSCDGPHLHFEVRNGSQTLTAETKAVDPLPLLREWPSVPVPSQG